MEKANLNFSSPGKANMGQVI